MVKCTYRQTWLTFYMWLTFYTCGGSHSRQLHVLTLPEVRTNDHRYDVCNPNKGDYSNKSCSSNYSSDLVITPHAQQG